MKYIYLQKYTDGSKDFFYVGKHSWEGVGIDPAYHGSGARLEGLTWVSQLMLEDTTALTPAEHSARESYWITYYAQLLGVAPFRYGERVPNQFVLEYARPDGRILNCHNTLSPDSSKPVWFVDDEGPMCMKDVQDRLAATVSSAWSYLGNPDSFIWNGHNVHKEGCTGGPVIDKSNSQSVEVVAKRVKTLQANGGLEKLHAAAQSESARRKRAATVSQKARLRRIIYTNGEFTGDYEQIADYIGYPRSSYKRVSRMLLGNERIPDKWSILKSFRQI